MIMDFYTLESFYGAQGAAQTVEQLISRYGETAVARSLSDGLITTQSLPCCCGSHETMKALCWLSDKGRILAASKTPHPQM